jgi:hypothetical protein
MCGVEKLIEKQLVDTWIAIIVCATIDWHAILASIICARFYVSSTKFWVTSIFFQISCKSYLFCDHV